MICKGNWVNTAKNIVYDNNKLSCELRKIDGSYEKNEIIFHDDYEYTNINGHFQWSFDNSILFLIINMNKNTDRWDKINKSFNILNAKYNCKYVRVEGVDGNNMENDSSAKEILKTRENLLGQKFTCIQSNETWEYDGTILKSFPGLKLNENKGTKGLTISNIKCLNLIKNEYPNYNWYCILEDDSEINKNSYNMILRYIKSIYNSADCILLDKRGKGRGGTCAVIYNQRIIKNMIEVLHPLSKFSIINESVYKRGPNLWDWKLFVYLDFCNIKHKIFPIVKSCFFKSEIG
jgi:hypothetical protein